MEHYVSEEPLFIDAIEPEVGKLIQIFQFIYIIINFFIGYQDFGNRF
jgi:hypothetical protein